MEKNTYTKISNGGIKEIINNEKIFRNRLFIFSDILENKKLQECKFENCKFKDFQIISFNLGTVDFSTCEFENFDMEYNVECGAGIHFLRTEEEAKRYTNLI